MKLIRGKSRLRYPYGDPAGDLFAHPGKPAQRPCQHIRDEYRKLHGDDEPKHTDKYQVALLFDHVDIDRLEVGDKTMLRASAPYDERRDFALGRFAPVWTELLRYHLGAVSEIVVRHQPVQPLGGFGGGGKLVAVTLVKARAEHQQHHRQRKQQEYPFHKGLKTYSVRHLFDLINFAAAKTKYSPASTISIAYSGSMRKPKTSRNCIMTATVSTANNISFTMRRGVKSG